MMRLHKGMCRRSGTTQTNSSRTGRFLEVITSESKIELAAVKQLANAVLVQKQKLTLASSRLWIEMGDAIRVLHSFRCY